MKKKIIVISLGGSLLYNEREINILYLKKFRSLILAALKKGNRVIIVVGGGWPARQFNQAANKLYSKVSMRRLVWMEIKAIKVSAEFNIKIFNGLAYFKGLTKPPEEVEYQSKIYKT